MSTAQRAKVIEAAHLIDGEWIREGELFESYSTSDGSLLCTAPIADAGIVDRAVMAARRAHQTSGWKERRAGDRARVLLEMADRLEAALPEISQLGSAEMGKPIRPMEVREIEGAADKLRYFAGAARVLDGTVTGASPAEVLDITVPYPVGVCGLVIPWNDPVDLAVRKIGAALAAGCTMVVKPSEETPASTEALFRLFDDLPGLPPGVINLVHGPGDPTGEALVSHPEVDKVSFTGSTATGKRIMELAARTLKRISVECGGKAPCLLFADCELDKALDALSFGAFFYAGQSCTAATRILVERPLYDRFVEEFARRVEALPVGDPLDRGSLVGPLVSERQVARVKAFLDGVAADGGTFVTGGTVDGLFIQPTIVTGVAPTSHIAREEVFGPVVCIFPFDSEADAISLANDVRYGLAASVWSRDVSRVLRVTRQLDFGDVWVNTHYIRQTETPFGGWKESGVGRELGLDGIREYLSFKRIAWDAAPDYHLKAWWDTSA